MSKDYSIPVNNSSYLRDTTIAPANTLIVGMTGCGKSTFAYRYLINAPAACRFIFDDLGRAATRLKIRPCCTARECEAALPTRWVVFNPHRMFPGNPKSAFRWFCQWVYACSKRGPGKKLFLADEIWQWQNNFQIPEEPALVVQTGREENIEFVCATQLPHKINASITGQSTELICFRLQERLAAGLHRRFGSEPGTDCRAAIGEIHQLQPHGGRKFEQKGVLTFGRRFQPQ